MWVDRDKVNRHVVLVTGGRDYTDSDSMRSRLSKYPVGTLLIHGEAIGADTMAGDIGVTLGFRVLSEPYFKESGKLGGPRRNQLLVDIARAYERSGYIVNVEAFPTPGCTGTWDCVNRAKLAGLPVDDGVR